jgi:hypothetical protein
MSFMERSDRFDELLGEARSRGDADQAVVGLLADPDLDPWFRTKAVAALGDVTGPVGSSALRAELSLMAREGLRRCSEPGGYRSAMALTWAYVVERAKCPASGHANGVSQDIGISG